MRLNLLHKKGFEYLRISRKMSKLSAVSLNMIRYNILASIKRTLDYDTIGGLFGDMYLGVHELTVVEKIWAIIIGVVAVVSELIDADSDELTIQIIENDK